MSYKHCLRNTRVKKILKEMRNDSTIVKFEFVWHSYDSTLWSFHSNTTDELNHSFGSWYSTLDDKYGFATLSHGIQWQVILYDDNTSQSTWVTGCSWNTVAVSDFHLSAMRVTCMKFTASDYFWATIACLVQHNSHFRRYTLRLSFWDS